MFFNAEAAGGIQLAIHVGVQQILGFSARHK
jgi:hypothetical protein